MEDAGVAEKRNRSLHTGIEMKQLLVRAKTQVMNLWILFMVTLCYFSTLRPGFVPVERASAESSAASVNDSTSKWHQRCIGYLAVARSQAAGINAVFTDRQPSLRTSMLDHFRGVDYPHYFVSFSTPGSEFQAIAGQRESESELNEIPSVWYPSDRTSIQPSDRRYYRSDRNRQLVSLDDAQNIRLVRYSYSRRINNVFAHIYSRLPPDQLRRIIPFFERALDECLRDGQHLSTAPCPRIAALPPRPIIPQLGLVSAPPLTIELRRVPQRGRLHLELGDWVYDLEDSNQKSNTREYQEHEVVPSGWYSYFRSDHVFSVDAPNGKSRKLTFPIDGNEKRVKIYVEIGHDAELLVRAVRYYSSLAGVTLKPDWRISPMNQPYYLLVNQSGKSIQSISPNHLFGTIQTLRVGQWSLYDAVSKFCPEVSFPQCGTVLKSGDWAETSVEAPRDNHVFPPGRYRYKVEYTVPNDNTCSDVENVYELFSEFEIPTPTPAFEPGGNQPPNRQNRSPRPG